MKEMTVQEIERALKWNMPFHIVIELVKGSGAMEWNINGQFSFPTPEEANIHFNRFKKNDKKLILLGHIKENGKFFFEKSLDPTYVVKDSTFYIKSDQREYVENSAGLKKEEGVLEFSPLVVPLTDGVWG